MFFNVGMSCIICLLHCRVLKSAKGLIGSSFTSNLQLADGEIILDVDGVMPTQPVLQHVGIAAWPGLAFDV